METILITGSSRGIGAATALRLARPGRRLILAARSAEALEAVAAEVRAKGAEARCLTVDLSEPEAARSAVERLAAEGPPFDGMILNAGASNNLLFSETTRALIRREMALNYLTPLELLAAALPDMRARGRGRVVVVGSLTSIVPFPGNASYSATKAALASLVRSLRCELRGSGVFVGLVLPGLTRTRLSEPFDSRFPAMSADAVGRAVAASYERCRPLVVPGFLNGLAARAVGAFPDLSERLLGHMSALLPGRTS